MQTSHSALGPPLERFFDPQASTWAINLKPGDVYATQRGENLLTVVGSAAVVCLLDSSRHRGAMSHFALPASDAATAYGRATLDTLVDAMVRNGGRLDDLRALIVGGAEINSPYPEGGTAALDLARHYLVDRGIRIGLDDVSDFLPRKVRCRVRDGTFSIDDLTQYNDTLHRRYVAYHRALASQWSDVPREADAETTADLHALAKDHRGLLNELATIDELVSGHEQHWVRAIIGHLDRLHDQLLRHFEAEEGSRLLARLSPGLAAELRRQHQSLLASLRRARVACDTHTDDEAPQVELLIRDLLAQLRHHELIERGLLAAAGVETAVLSAEASTDDGHVFLVWAPESLD